MNDEAKLRAAATYNAAADYFDAPALSFWDRFGRRTVERLSLSDGAVILDACCGSGASAIPACEAVGPTGRVLGIDLAENLIQLGREKAQRQGLTALEFRVGDIEALDPAVEMFDAVICVFGIFFLPDMRAGVRSLWRLVRPGGQLAITTWGPRFAEPGSSAFWAAVKNERPDLYKGFNPWDRLTDPREVEALFREAGVAPDVVEPESSMQPLQTPDDFWTIVMGSGYRGTVEQLQTHECERVRTATVTSLADREVRTVETNAIFAIARKLRDGGLSR